MAPTDISGALQPLVIQLAVESECTRVFEQNGMDKFQIAPLSRAGWTKRKQKSYSISTLAMIIPYSNTVLSLGLLWKYLTDINM